MSASLQQASSAAGAPRSEDAGVPGRGMRNDSSAVGSAEGVGASPLQHPRAHAGGRAGVASSHLGWFSPPYGGKGRGTGVEGGLPDSSVAWGAGASSQGLGLGPVGVRASAGGAAPPMSRHQMASVIQHSIEFGHAAQRIQVRVCVHACPWLAH